MAIELEKECTLGFYNDIALLDEKKNVYLVQNECTNKIFVKKVIKTYNIEVYENLKKHPHKNIPIIYEFFETDSQLIVIEEFINGMDLEELINKTGKLKEKVVEEYISQILDGLDHIHNLDPPVIHRDIKLSNVMINNDGIIKIIDFNTSRLYDQNDSKDTVIMGTAGYAAPEQYGFTQTDCRSDIYAVGVLLNYLLTGNHLHDELHQSKYTSIIEKCTNLSPDMRFISINQLRIALNKKAGDSLKEKKPAYSLWSIPGFRTKQGWKKIIAILGYLLIVYFALTMENTDLSPVANVIDRILFLLMLLTLVALYSNYLNMQNKLPLCKSDKFLLRIVGCILFTPVIFVIYAFLAGFFASF